MNYYLWTELKAIVGSMMVWDSFFTMLKHSSLEDIAYAYVHSDIGTTAIWFLMAGMLFLISAFAGGVGFVSEGYALLSNKHYISDTTISS